jgi:hypothetical protein
LSDEEREASLPLARDIIETRKDINSRLWVESAKCLLKKTLLHQVFLSVLRHNGIEILFFPEQVPALAIDVNNPGFMGHHR